MAHYEKRGSTYHFRMRVPDRFAGVEERKIIKASLRTDSEAEAAFAAEKMRRELVATWTARLAGEDRTQPVAIPFEQITSIAKERYGAYKTHDQLTLGELVRRLIVLNSQDPNADNPEVIAAVLGAAAPPDLRMSGLVEFYERERRTENTGKDANAMRKWRNPLKAAVADFIDVARDLRLLELTHEEAIAYVDRLKDRVMAGELKDATANKAIGFLRIMVKAHDRRFRVGRVNPFDGLSVSGGKKKVKKRAEFSDAWIRENLLCENPLPGLNDEARDLLIICALTGARPSEVSGVLPRHMRLDDPVPHIELRDEGRRLKTEHSARDLPLVGAALDAARRHPQGFPRYAGKAGLSDTVNKYLRENGLLPTDGHTLYSLRHSFEGRMSRIKIPNRDAAQMMGHSVKAAIGREAYGDDLTLLDRLAIIKAVYPGEL